MIHEKLGNNVMLTVTNPRLREQKEKIMKFYKKIIPFGILFTLVNLPLASMKREFSCSSEEKQLAISTQGANETTNPFTQLPLEIRQHILLLVLEESLNYNFQPFKVCTVPSKWVKFSSDGEIILT
ncbi:hypothetical protein H0W26_00760, partial [Candidatus Dependentiae bacterium]|nr:hypothetical protein [Candidatus Dependentiae bacterium]